MRRTFTPSLAGGRDRVLAEARLDGFPMIHSERFPTARDLYLSQSVSPAGKGYWDKRPDPRGRELELWGTGPLSPVWWERHSAHPNSGV